MQQGSPFGPYLEYRRRLGGGGGGGPPLSACVFTRPQNIHLLSKRPDNLIPRIPSCSIPVSFTLARRSRDDTQRYRVHWSRIKISFRNFARRSTSGIRDRLGHDTLFNAVRFSRDGCWMELNGGSGTVWMIT